MKKIQLKLALLFLIFLSPSSYAQNNEQAEDALQQIKGVAAYNATIIGYAISCDFPKEQIQLIKSQIVAGIDNVGLKDNDYVEVQKIFMETLQIAKTKGPVNSKYNCSSFKIEFDKIYTALKNSNS